MPTLGIHPRAVALAILPAYGRWMTKAFIRGYGGRTVVWVRTPHAGELHGVLAVEGGSVTIVEPGLLRVTGLTAAEIGDLAVERGAPIHELRTQRRCGVGSRRTPP